MSGKSMDNKFTITATIVVENCILDLLVGNVVGDVAPTNATGS